MVKRPARLSDDQKIAIAKLTDASLYREVPTKDGYVREPLMSEERILHEFGLNTAEEIDINAADGRRINAARAAHAEHLRGMWRPPPPRPPLAGSVVTICEAVTWLAFGEALTASALSDRRRANGGRLPPTDDIAIDCAWHEIKPALASGRVMALGRKQEDTEDPRSGIVVVKDPPVKRPKVEIPASYFLESVRPLLDLGDHLGLDILAWGDGGQPSIHVGYVDVSLPTAGVQQIGDTFVSGIGDPASLEPKPKRQTTRREPPYYAPLRKMLEALYELSAGNLRLPERDLVREIKRKWDHKIPLKSDERVRVVIRKMVKGIREKSRRAN